MKTDKLLHLITQSAPMREAGRLPLPRAQSGSSVQPYVTTNPNDPRIQAYNDSLTLHNNILQTFDTDAQTRNMPVSDGKGGINYDYYKNEMEYMVKNKMPVTADFFDKSSNRRAYNRLTKLNNESPKVNWKVNNNLYTQSFKEPTQKIILDKTDSYIPLIPTKGFDVNNSTESNLQNSKQSGFGKWMGPDGIWHQEYQLPDNLKKGSNWRKQSGGTSWFNQQVVQDANARMNSTPTTTLGTHLSTPESRSYEKRAGYLETHPEKYNTKDYRAGHKEEGLGNDVFSDPVAMAAALTAAGVGTGAVALSSIPRTFGTHLVDQATYGLSNFKNLLNIGKKSDYNGLIDLFNKANIDARNKYNITNFGETAGSLEDLVNFKPGSYGAKLATDVFEGKYPMYSSTQNIHFGDLFDKKTGYTDIPSFNKQVNDLKIKLSHGKFPMETRMNHIVTSPKDKFDYMHQSILGNNAVDYASPELTEYQFLHPNMSKEFNTKEFNTLFPDKFGARDAYKMPHGIMPNKFGGSTKIRLKRNG